MHLWLICFAIQIIHDRNFQCSAIFKCSFYVAHTLTEQHMQTGK